MVEIFTGTAEEALIKGASFETETVIVDTTNGDGNMSETLKVYVPSVVTLSLSYDLDEKSFEKVLIPTAHHNVKALLAPTLWSNFMLLPEGFHKKVVETLSQRNVNVIILTHPDGSHNYHKYALTLI